VLHVVGPLGVRHGCRKVRTCVRIRRPYSWVVVRLVDGDLGEIRVKFPPRRAGEVSNTATLVGSLYG
jgi:hypothetical protein